MSKYFQKKVGPVLLALSSALLLILSFPDFDYHWLSWFALVPLFVAFRDASLKAAFGVALLTGIGFIAGVFFWVNIVSSFKLTDYIAPVFFLASQIGLFGLFFCLVERESILPAIVAAPSLWVLMEYVRSHAGFLALPWALLGHSQHPNIPIIQMSSYTGVFGLSFLIVMVNMALGQAVQSRFRNLRPAIFALLIVLLMHMYGLVVLKKEAQGLKIPVTVIQGNIPQEKKWDPGLRDYNLNKHIILAREAAQRDETSLIIWPETAVQGSFRHELSLVKRISSLAKETHAGLVLGSSQMPKSGKREFRRKNLYNSAFLVSARGIIEGQYNKIHLLPFAEYLPAQNLIPWPAKYEKVNNYIPGNEYTIFSLDGIKFGVLICWENIFPDLFRQFVKEGAQFMINITNEAWFGETAAPYQFLSMSVFRAVENRIPVVRSANTGVSCFIDAHGRIIGRVNNAKKDIFVDGYLTKEVTLSVGKSFYTRYGDIFAFVNIALSIVLVGLSLLRKVRR